MKEFETSRIPSFRRELRKLKDYISLKDFLTKRIFHSSGFLFPFKYSATATPPTTNVL
jgi:hypothetical protein